MCITGFIFISCVTINLGQRDDSVFLKKWQDASSKSIADQMTMYKNDSACLNNLMNSRTSLLSGLRKKFYDSCVKNNDRIYGNEFYILETSTRSESMRFDFYIESKQKQDKIFHYSCEKSCLLLSEKTININEPNSLERFFNENNPSTCSDYFPLGSFIISHFKNNEVVSKVYTFPSKEVLHTLVQALKIFEKE